MSAMRMLKLLCCLGLLWGVEVARADVRAQHDGDDLVLRGPPGLRVTILDAEEKRVGHGRTDGQGVLRLRGLADADPMHRIAVLDGTRRPLSALFQSVEILSVLPQRVSSGLPIVAHVRVLSRADRSPAGDVDVEVGLTCDARAHWLGRMRTGADGVARVGDSPLAVPAGLEGDCDLVVRAEGARIGRPVVVQRGVQVVVSTDRPAYKPGDTAHGRALVLDQATSKPVSGANGHFVLAQPGGRVLARVAATSSPFGVANATLAIPAEGIGPDVTVRYEVQGATGEARARVGRYVPERLSVVATPDAGAARPGAGLTLEVALARLDGGPVEGSRVEVVGRSDGEVVFRADAVAETHGAQVPVTIPAVVTEDLAIEVRAETPGGDSGTTRLSLPVDTGGLTVFAIPESGRANGGLTAGVWVVVQRPDGTPVAADLRLSAGTVRVTGRTDEQGVAQVRIPLPARGGRLTVSARTGDRTGSRSVEVAAASPQTAALEIPSALVDAGSPMEVVYRARSWKGPAVVEVVRQGQSVASAVVPLVKGVGRATVTIPAGLSGSLQLRGWHLTERGAIGGDARLVVARAREDLTVRLSADRAVYRPRDEARVEVAVADMAGNPVVAAVGLTVVDAGLRALGLQQPGVERALARLGERWTPAEAGAIPDWAREALYRANDARRLSVLASAVEADLALQPPEETAVRRLNEVRSVWGQRMDARVQALVARLNRHLKRTPAAREKPVDLSALAARGVIRTADTRDPWGQPLKVTVEREESCCLAQLTLHSVGLDGLSDTADDIKAAADLQHYFVNCQSNCGLGFAGFGVGAGGGARHASRAYMGVGRATARVEQPLRTDFPDTLAVEPALITDEQGRATWTVRLADSLTRWLVQARAVSRAGGLGAAEHELQVSQPFSVEAALPPALTLGDRMQVPVAVTNQTDAEQNVTLEVRAGGALEASLSEVLTIPAGATRALPAMIKAPRVGEGWFEVRADAGGLRDGVRRTLVVEPDGIPVQTAVAGGLTGAREVTAAVTLAAGGIAGTERVTLRLYPSAVGPAMEGLEALLASPAGCFEQMSATTYPNALVMGYLQETRQSNPTVELRARALLQAGYRGLAGYEVAGGGFSWFGDAPANQVLTAFGLMEFERMAPHTEVSRPLLDRTRAWLLKQRQADGAFRPDASYLHAESWKAIQNTALPVTAYITWALLRAGAGDDAAPSVSWLAQHAAEASTNYEKALVALALSEAAHPAGEGARRRLLESARTAEDGLFWPGDGPTATFAEGPSAQVETAAVAALALMAGGDAPSEAAQVVGWLSARRAAGAGWGTTQATVLALEALLRHEATGREPAEGTVRVVSEGEIVAEHVMTPRDADVIRTVTLPAAVGERTVALRLAGSGGLSWQLSAEQYRRTDATPATPGPLRLAVTADRWRLGLGERVTLRVVLTAGDHEVRMPTAEIGLPAGFELDRGSLDETAFARVEVLGRKVVFYLTDLAAGARVETAFTLTARRAGRLAPGPARAWPYYQPDRTTWIPQVPLEVAPSDPSEEP